MFSLNDTLNSLKNVQKQTQILSACYRSNEHFPVRTRKKGISPEIVIETKFSQGIFMIHLIRHFGYVCRPFFS